MYGSISEILQTYSIASLYKNCQKSNSKHQSGHSPHMASSSGFRTKLSVKALVEPCEDNANCTVVKIQSRVRRRTDRSSHADLVPEPAES